MRKGRLVKYKIRNQVYHRFTNRGKGYTPIKLNIKIQNTYTSSYKPLFKDINRILSISTKNKLYRDLLFNQYSFSNPKELIEYSSTLKSNNICLFRLSGNSHIYLHFFDGDNYVEHFSSYLPGIYFLNGNWFFTDIMSTELYYYTNLSYRSDGSTYDTLKYPDHVSYVTNTTPYSCDRVALPNNTFSIYIPFESIQTPILQAYLPIYSEVGGYNKTSDLNTLLLIGDVYWMGVSVQSKKERFMLDPSDPTDYKEKICNLATPIFSPFPMSSVFVDHIES